MRLQRGTNLRGKAGGRQKHNMSKIVTWKEWKGHIERKTGREGKKKGEGERERERARTTNTPPLFFALYPSRPHLCQGSRLSLRGSSWWRTKMPNNLSEIRGDAPTTRSSAWTDCSSRTRCSSLIIDKMAVHTFHFGPP